MNRQRNASTVKIRSPRGKMPGTPFWLWSGCEGEPGASRRGDVSGTLVGCPKIRHTNTLNRGGKHPRVTGVDGRALLGIIAVDKETAFETRGRPPVGAEGSESPRIRTPARKPIRFKASLGDARVGNRFRKHSNVSICPYAVGLEVNRGEFSTRGGETRDCVRRGGLYARRKNIVSRQPRAFL